MMQHKYPFTALHVSIDSSLLDVNVHPTKMELRFTNQEQIYPFITKMIDDSISGRELIPDAGYDNEKEQNQRRQEEVKEQKKLIAYKPLPEPFELNRKKSEDENSQNANACVDQASLNRFMTKPMMTEARPVTRKFDYTGSKPVEVSKENAIKKDEMVEAENKPVNEVNEEFEYKVN